MDTTVNALKNLYTALGGTNADVVNISTIPDMVNAIATQVAANAEANATANESAETNP